MPAFRCTGKLLKELGLKKPELIDPHPDDWHANLLRFGPKKFVLFCSTKTLFTCLTPPVSRAEIRDLDTLFFSALHSAMVAEGFSSASFSYVMAKYKDMEIAKTYDKSVLGSMTDYLFHIDSIFWHADGFEGLDFGQVSFKLNTIPQVKREFFSASDAFKKTLIREVV